MIKIHKKPKQKPTEINDDIFEPGDLVVCVDNSAREGRLVVGKTYTIHSIHQPLRCPSSIRFYIVGQEGQYYYPSRFRRISKGTM